MRTLKTLTALAICAALTCIIVIDADAQYGRTKKKPDPSPAASVSQTIGTDNKITISYHRPAVKGRDIYGDGTLVPNGKVWRAGANETTTITVDTDVLFEGKKLPAGTYGFHIIPSDGDWTLIVDKEWETWGSFQYKEANDVLRATVTPTTVPNKERLVYGFADLGEANSVTAYLAFGTKKASFKIELDD